MGKKRHSDDQGGAFWSGTISCGLVSIPVDLYAAHRPRSAALRMVDRQGTPLQRRYICPQDRKPLARREIVRGYELEEGRYILVTDEELAALEPRKSREIDLRCFVEETALDPVYFAHAYFLVPAGSVTKAYRLLAEIMERSGKAGIATFVMREREHLVAILAAGGMLRAEILRFADEVRSPAEVGLPTLEPAPPLKVQRLQQAMNKLARTELAQEQLRDRHRSRLLALVRRKLKAGEGVVVRPETEEAEGPEGAEIIDLMKIIKDRFQTAGRKAANKESD